jgi:hypothetical protein
MRPRSKLARDLETGKSEDCIFFEVSKAVNFIFFDNIKQWSFHTSAALVVGFFMAGVLTACSATPPPPPPQPVAYQAPSQNGEHLAGIGSETVVTIHGKIVSVDREKMLVTIQGPDGKLLPIHVYNPYNLAAAKPGGNFVARFYEIVTIRKKLPGEAIPAAAMAQGLISASPGQTPGAAFGRQMQVVATITAIDTAKNTVELKGPDGAIETVNVANPENLAQVKTGEEIVITLTNVVAIALEKESAV